MTSTEEVDETRVNFIDIEEQKDYDLLPNGRYRMDLSDLENQEVQNGPNEGARKLKIELTVQPGEDFENRKVWDSITCVPKSLWKAKALFTACGFEHLDSVTYSTKTQEFTYTDEDGDELVLDVTNFVGTVLDVKVGTRPKNKDKETGAEYAAQNQVKAYYYVELDDDDLMP